MFSTASSNSIHCEVRGEKEKEDFAEERKEKKSLSCLVFAFHASIPFLEIRLMGGGE